MADPLAATDSTILTPRALRVEFLRILDTCCEAENAGPEQPFTFRLLWHIGLKINGLMAEQFSLLRQDDDTK